VESMPIKNFRELEIWKRSVDLTEYIYKETNDFPKDELYGLTSQLRRAAVSIPSNIAEGFTRLHNREYKQFLYVSLGSCSEVITQLIIAEKLGYIEKKKADWLIDEIEQISKMTMSLIKKLNTNN
jgi:four helix bundle protein